MIERPSLAALCEQLRARIRDGRLAAGARLVEAELAFELETSRAPLREAIMILAGERLVELVPHKGGRVRQFAPAELATRYALRASLAGTLASLAARACAERDKEQGEASNEAEALVKAQAAIDAYEETGGAADLKGIADLEARYFDALSMIVGDTELRRMLDASVLPLERAAAGGVPHAAQLRRLSQMLTRAVLEGIPVLAEQIARELAGAQI